MMYAVIKTGGKQYRVAPGDVLRVEKLPVEAGQTVEIDEVLMVGGDGESRVGEPLLAGVKVSAEVVGHGRGDKVHILKFRRRKHHMKHQGHRQYYTALKITGIQG